MLQTETSRVRHEPSDSNESMRPREGRQNVSRDVLGFDVLQKGGVQDAELRDEMEWIGCASNSSKGWLTWRLACGLWRRANDRQSY
jgi:hypothetical protein